MDKEHLHELTEKITAVIKEIKYDNCDECESQERFNGCKGCHYHMAIETLELQIPKKPKIKPWEPAMCPACGEELSEHMGDGYYKHMKYLTRCPNSDCAQRLQWE